MEYRKLEASDVNDFVENRVEFATLIRNIENVDLFKEKTREYIEEHIDKDDLIIYIAVDNKKIVSSCMLCIFNTAPLPSTLNGKIGELLNVYTKNEYRRQGHSKRLIKLLMDEAKKRNVSKIILNYTDDGYPLYKSLGFKKVNDEMEYRLR